tara:strand:- start:13942 stop:15252 length:1311 start_codon:yes stop_codon:yes gene_type:complete
MSDDKKQPTAAEQKTETISEMMANARANREANSHLIATVRDDPALADEVRDLLCADLRRVAELPRELFPPSASRERYREHGYYSEQLIRYTIGTHAEFKRKAGLDESAAEKKIYSNISKTLRAQGVMQYAEKHVKPWDGAYDRLDMSQDMVTLQIGSDFHGRYGCPFAQRVWGEVRDMVQPDAFRYNGDMADFPKLSSHRQLPGHFPLTIRQDADAFTNGYTRPDREACPDADQKIILGNHDARLIYALAEAPNALYELGDYLDFHTMFHLDELECGLVAKSSFLNPTERARRKDIAKNWEVLYDANGQPFWTTVHGFLTGAGSAKKHLDRFMTYGTNGHMHNPETASGGTLATGSVRWFQTGCMAYPYGVGEGYYPGPIEHSGWYSTFIIARLFPKHRHVQVEEVTVGRSLAYFGDHYWEITTEEEDIRQAMLEV